MSTRTIAGKLENLIERTTELENLGSQIQLDDEATAASAAMKLDHEYRGWYAESLTALPDDLKDKFRTEYEGGAFRFRIKHFLSEPRERSAFCKSLEADARDTLNVSPWQYSFNDTFRSPLMAQNQLLMEALARLGVSSILLGGLALLERITRRLPIAFAVLRKEIQKRAGIEVHDEYDVQRILHAVAVLQFEEVEDEEPTPKMAGGSSRLDFLLKQERISVETKMIGPNLSIRRLRSDLAEDIVYFRAHPDADALFIFIYDPDRKITNATGFERDLYSDSDEFPVRVVVAS